MIPEEHDISADEINQAAEIERANRRATGHRLSEMNAAEVSREVIQAIQRHVKPERIAEVLDRMLGATRVLKNGVELDDTRAQEAAVKLYLAYVVGMPVQRSETVTVALDADSAIDIRERLRRSPAMLANLAAVVDEVRAESAKTVGDGSK